MNVHGYISIVVLLPVVHICVWTTPKCKFLTLNVVVNRNRIVIIS